MRIEFFFLLYGCHRDFLCFPTRRCSDLANLHILDEVRGESPIFNVLYNMYIVGVLVRLRPAPQTGRTHVCSGFSLSLSLFPSALLALLMTCQASCLRLSQGGMSQF